MSLRNWAIRGLILAGMAAVAAFAWVANSWVSPERVRAQVIANLRQQLDDDIQVQVGSARMRILGGIAVSDLKLTRLTPAGEVTILSVPSIVLYHDKEQLNRGQLVIKKIELENPELTLERSADGKWNLARMFREGPADKPVPTFVVRDGTVHFIDRGDEPFPELTLSGVHLTLVNDPVPMLVVQQARAASKKLGPVTVWARFNRVSGELNLEVDLAAIPLGHVVGENADRFLPGLAPHLKGLAATAVVNAKLNYNPANSARPWRHDVKIKLKDARYTHPELPWPVEGITAAVEIADGRVTVEEATAQIAGAKVRFKMESRSDGTVASRTSEDDPLKRLEDHLVRLEMWIDDLSLDDALFKNLPARAQRVRTQFSPAGRVDLKYSFERKNAEWKRVLEIQPKQIAMSYEKFRYPITDVHGVVTRTVLPAGEPVTVINLTGTANRQTITIKGAITGEGEDPGIDLRVTGANIPIDRALSEAMPEKYRRLVEKFRVEGRGDFIAEFVQARGVNRCDNEFRIDIREARLCHEDFPYLLEKVKGRLYLRVSARDLARHVRPGEKLDADPEHDEMILDGITAVHDGATVALNGSKRPIPDTRDKRLLIHMTGSNCPMDGDLRALCRAFKIDSVWTAFNPAGKFSFTADLDFLDRGPPADQPDRAPPFVPATDLNLKLAFSGATVTPSFFRYELNDFAGWLEYKNDRVDLVRFTGRHGESQVKLERGEARFYPNGVVWADLHGLEVKPVIADDAFIRALPAKLGSGLEQMKIKGRSELLVKQLVVLTPPDAPGLLPNIPAPPAVNPVSQSLYQGQPSARNDVIPAGGSIAGSVLPRGQTPPAQPDPVVYWDLELKVIAASFDTGVDWDKAFGAIGCRGRYEGTHLGEVLGSIWIEHTSIAGQPVSKIGGRFNAEKQKPDPVRPGEYFPTEVGFKDLTGELFHGSLGGEARLALSAPVRFFLWLKAADVQLEEVSKHYKLDPNPDLKGIAQAQLRLENRYDPASGKIVVEGSGVIDVPTGKIAKLPILLDLLKLLKFNTPDSTAFEEAHAIFHIQGDRVKVDQIDLIGRSVCLGGAGEFDTSGTYVNFDFYTIYSQVLARLVNTPVGDLTAFLSKNLFVIKLTRENGELKYKPEPVPIVIEPARAIADRLRLRFFQFWGTLGGK